MLSCLSEDVWKQQQQQQQIFIYNNIYWDIIAIPQVAVPIDWQHWLEENLLLKDGFDKYMYMNRICCSCVKFQLFSETLDWCILFYRVERWPSNLSTTDNSESNFAKEWRFHNINLTFAGHLNFIAHSNWTFFLWINNVIIWCLFSFRQDLNK